jgi:hypothetical protein
MSTTKRKPGAQIQIMGTGDGYVTLSGVTESFSNDIDLESSGHVGAQIIVEVDYDATPTDEVEISLYGSLDGSNYDDTPLWSMRGDKSVDPQQLSFIVKDVFHARIGVKQTGSTDSHDVRAYIQKWSYETV